MIQKTIIFEGKVTLAGQLVDFRIYKNEGEDIINHYSFEINPEVKDASLAGYHRGDIQQAKTLDELLFQFNLFQKEISEIVETRENRNF